MSDTYKLYTRSTDLGMVVSDLHNGHCYTTRQAAEDAYPDTEYDTFEITVMRHEDMEYVGQIATVVEEMRV